MDLYIIGVGPAGKKHLSAEAHALISGADLVLATKRIYTAFAQLNANTRSLKLPEMAKAVREAQHLGSVALLVSGDSGFFSLGSSVAQNLGDLAGLKIRHICGLSSLQYLASKVGISYEDAKIISLHGRLGSILPYASYNPKVFALTGGAIKAHDVIAELVEAGLGGLRVIVGENLGGEGQSELISGGTAQNATNERTAEPILDSAARKLAGESGQEPINGDSELKLVRENTAELILENLAELILDDTAQNLVGRKFSDLTCLFVLNNNCANPQDHLLDKAFIRGESLTKTIPMTKQAVRTLAIAALNIQAGDTVYDIGAGTGSVAVEMARKAQSGMVYALERNALALELLAQNRVKFGAFNLRILAAEAPDGLDALPVPDKVFIGGSGGKLGKILQLVLQKKATARIVVTAITLETLSEAVQLFNEHGLEPEISCINAAVAQKTGHYNMMKAENPVYIISGGGNAG